MSELHDAIELAIKEHCAGGDLWLCANIASKPFDTRIAELERECSQWRDELRIYRETENKRIAELEQSVTVRDTEIARLETDLELARRDAERINRLSAHLADDITICPPGKHGKGDGWLIFWQTGWDNYGQIGEETHGATLRDAIDAARAGNGGGV